MQEGNGEIINFYSKYVENIKGPNKSGWCSGLCPTHDDNNPSFSFEIKYGNWKCHAGCGEGTIGDFAEMLEVEYPSDNGKGRRLIEDTYDYRDEEGNILYQAVRYKPKGFSQRRPDGNGGWIDNVKGVRIVPYNLPELIESDYALIVEGEKDTDNLKRLGFVATTNPMGAGKWNEGYNDYYKNKDVIIISDNDKQGREHAKTVANSLYEVAKSTCILELSGLPDKGDISDWLEDGGTADELVRLINECPEWEPMKEPELITKLPTLAEIYDMDIKVGWIVEKLIPKDAIIVLFGKGGVGKSTLSFQIGKAISEDRPIFGLRTTKTPVVYIDFDNPLTVVYDIAKALGRCEGITVWHTSNKEIPPPRLDSKNWELYKELPEGSLIIFDTLRAMQGLDENDSKQMGLVMNRLKELRDYGFTIILLHHTPKANESIYKGSTAISDLCDHVIGLEQVKRDKQTPIDDEEDGEGRFFRFGNVDQKSRYEKHHIFLTTNPEGRGFQLAPDPDDELMIKIYEVIIEGGASLNQSRLTGLISERLGVKKAKTRNLFNKGEDKLWMVIKGDKNAKIYYPFLFNGVHNYLDLSKEERLRMKIKRNEAEKLLSETVKRRLGI